MRRIATIALFVALPALAAAGGKASGKVIGKTLEVKDAVLLKGTGASRQPVLIFGLTSAGGLCDREKKGQNRADSVNLVIQLNQLPEKAKEGFKPGDYSVVREGTAPPDRPFAAAWFTTYDGKCSEHELPARGGMVKLAAFDGKSGKGTFDIDFGEGEKLSGDFDASLCDAPEKVPDGGCQK